MIARAAALVSVPMVLFILAVVWGLAGCASVKADDDGIRLSEERQAQCAAEGGCILITRKALATALIYTAAQTCKGTDI